MLRPFFLKRLEQDIDWELAARQTPMTSYGSQAKCYYAVSVAPCGIF
jgi:hypothetical protein